MIKDKLNIKGLKERFSNGSAIKKGQITDFYRENEPQLSQTAINYRIFTLTQKRVLHRVGHGKYVFEGRPEFLPEIRPELIEMDRLIKNHFPYLHFCTWSTAYINEFMLHQPSLIINLLEVEFDARESVFYFLKDSGYSVFLESDKNTITKYLPDNDKYWIIKSLISEAPTQLLHGVPTVTLEKLLVDLFADIDLFTVFQGSEMNRIIEEAFGKYLINENKMLRYAARRGKKEQLSKFIEKVSKNQ